MNKDYVLKEPQVDEALMSSLLQCDESLRRGKMADTATVSGDPEFLQNLETAALHFQRLTGTWRDRFASGWTYTDCR